MRTAAVKFEVFAKMGEAFNQLHEFADLVIGDKLKPGFFHLD